MRIEYINPFIEAVYTLFSTMLGCTVQRGEIGLRESAVEGDITAIIGLSGPARGTVALTFPDDTAVSMVGRFLRMEGPEVEENVPDGVAELVNIVAGSAKARFHDPSVKDPINLSLPTVIRGEKYSVRYPSQSQWLDVPFASELGSFRMRVTFDMEDKKGARS